MLARFKNCDLAPDEKKVVDNVEKYGWHVVLINPCSLGFVSKHRRHSWACALTLRPKEQGFASGRTPTRVINPKRGHF